MDSASIISCGFTPDWSRMIDWLVSANPLRLVLLCLTQLVDPVLPIPGKSIIIFTHDYCWVYLISSLMRVFNSFSLVTLAINFLCSSIPWVFKLFMQSVLISFDYLHPIENFESVENLGSRIPFLQFRSRELACCRIQGIFLKWRALVKAAQKPNWRSSHLEKCFNETKLLYYSLPPVSLPQFLLVHVNLQTCCCFISVYTMY